MVPRANTTWTSGHGAADAGADVMGEPSIIEVRGRAAATQQGMAFIAESPILGLPSLRYIALD